MSENSGMSEDAAMSIAEQNADAPVTDAPASDAPASVVPAGDAPLASEVPAPPPARATPPAIQTQALTKAYGSLLALDHLDLALETGDVFGFIGPNGAGKSTTMKILAGLLQPTSGSAYVLGKDVMHNGENEITVFQDARAIIKGTDDVAAARSIYAKFVGY